MDGLSINEIAAKYKLLPVRGCNCNGGYTVKYSDGRYFLEHQPKFFRFRIAYINRIEVPWTPIAQLTEKLDEVFKPLQKKS